MIVEPPSLPMVRRGQHRLLDGEYPPMRVYKRHPGGRFEPIATQDITRASVGPQGEVMLRLDLGTHELLVDLRSDEVDQIVALTAKARNGRRLF